VKDIHDFDQAQIAARFAAPPASQRAVVEAILEEKPNYRYNLAPPIYPPPKPGLASALAAVTALVARIKGKRAGEADRPIIPEIVYDSWHQLQARSWSWDGKPEKGRMADNETIAAMLAAAVIQTDPFTDLPQTGGKFDVIEVSRRAVAIYETILGMLPRPKDRPAIRT